jgi:hypothetical protein
MAIRSPRWVVVAALVSLAPDTPGVFELWDGDELVYVGRTRDERATLRGELERRLLEEHVSATHFRWEITFHPAARERELLAEYERAHHRSPRLNSELSA